MRLAALLAALVLPFGARAADTVRVLFVGNSHTYVNDLPALFSGLSASGGRQVLTAMSAPGGYSLRQHTSFDPTLDSIARGGWDWVVLQEQSQIPAIAYWRDSAMYPAVRRLDSLIRAAGCGTMLYMTWGWKNGGRHTYQGHSSPEFTDYFEMQESVRVAYLGIGEELGVPVSPVGWAWYRARRIDSLVDLWQADECHATLKGTYLAACVFYARAFNADPTGLEFSGGLSPADARFCQEVAWLTVSGLADLPGPKPARAAGLVVHPNPTSGRVRIGRDLRAGKAHLAVYDSQGRVVRRLGYASDWDGTDGCGATVPPAAYFISDGTATVPVVMLRR